MGFRLVHSVVEVGAGPGAALGPVEKHFREWSARSVWERMRRNLREPLGYCGWGMGVSGNAGFAVLPDEAPDDCAL